MRRLFERDAEAVCDAVEVIAGRFGQGVDGAVGHQDGGGQGVGQ